MKYRTLGKTGYDISAVIYGGVVSAGKYDGMIMPGNGQKNSDEYVSWAVEQGINYFDVAPSYGDAEEMMGNSLQPWRDKVYLACKTNRRDAAGAEEELIRSLKLLHTDYFDVYQLHGICSMEEMEQAFAPGGVMEVMEKYHKNGTIRQVGFTAHCQKAAIEMIRRYDFATVLFPFNWHMHMAHDMGKLLLPAAREKGMGVLCMKSMIERAWLPGEKAASRYPKSWCRPFDTVKQHDLLEAAVKYAVSLGVDAIVPPGNFEHLRFAVQEIDRLLSEPFSAEEKKLLQEHLVKVQAYPFFEKEMWEL